MFINLKLVLLWTTRASDNLIWYFPIILERSLCHNLCIYFQKQKLFFTFKLQLPSLILYHFHTTDDFYNFKTLSCFLHIFSWCGTLFNTVATFTKRFFSLQRNNKYFNCFYVLHINCSNFCFREKLIKKKTKKTVPS